MTFTQPDIQHWKLDFDPSWGLYLIWREWWMSSSVRRKEGLVCLLVRIQSSSVRFLRSGRVEFPAQFSLSIHTHISYCKATPAANLSSRGSRPLSVLSIRVRYLVGRSIRTLHTDTLSDDLSQRTFLDHGSGGHSSLIDDSLGRPPAAGRGHRPQKLQGRENSIPTALPEMSQCS